MSETVSLPPFIVTVQTTTSNSHLVSRKTRKKDLQDTLNIYTMKATRVREESEVATWSFDSLKWMVDNLVESLTDTHICLWGNKVEIKKMGNGNSVLKRKPQNKVVGFGIVLQDSLVCV